MRLHAPHVGLPHRFSRARSHVRLPLWIGLMVAIAGAGVLWWAIILGVVHLLKAL